MVLCSIILDHYNSQRFKMISNDNNSVMSVAEIVRVVKKRYVLFFSPYCTYSMRAIDHLKSNGTPFDAYDVARFGGIDQVHSDLLNINEFDPSHTTIPMIFLNGQFIGGCDDLLRLAKKYK